MSPDERLDRIDANLADLKRSVGELMAAVGGLTAPVGLLTASVSEITASISELKATDSQLMDSHANLARYVLDFREETARRLDVIDNRLDVLAAHVSNIDARYPAFTKAILDFGKIAAQLTIDQAANKSAITELAQKVAKLNPAA